jgi:4-aminobutyrate aminotransferase-like enzyme
MTSRQVLELVREYESRNINFFSPDGSWPIVWERARGINVWDADGRKYLDLTAAFGVAATGHANALVVRAASQQMRKLLHAMGDVHPHPLKAQLARELSRFTFERWNAGRPGSSSKRTGKAKVIFCNSGFEAVEAALKTAARATGRTGVIAFSGAYHGTGYGALSATHRSHFREGFSGQLRKFGHFCPFPESVYALREVKASISTLVARHSIGAVLVEPIQGRGGIRIPPPEFLPLLRRICDRHRLVFILDEIYTGFGRTGRWFACEHTGAVPDLVCLGKAMTGGFPLSACVGLAALMDAAWPPSAREAIHTSTFLGHPVGCAMALAQMNELRSRKLARRSETLGRILLKRLFAVDELPEGRTATVRGMGLMAGLEVREPDGSPATSYVFHVIQTMLRRGYILLPEGEHGNVISFTPPLTITADQIHSACSALVQVLRGEFA